MKKKFKNKILTIAPTFVTNFITKIFQSDINKKIAKGAFWSLSGTIVSKGLLVISSIIVARILGAEVFGQAGIIRSTVNMFSAFAGMGIGLTSTKYISEFKNSNPVKVLKIVKLSNIVTVITAFTIAVFILIFSQQIANQINAPNLKTELQISSLILFFNTLNGVQLGILAGFEDFKSIAKNNLTAGIVSFFLQIIMAYLWGLTGTIIGFGTNFFVLWVMNKNIVIKHTKSLGNFPKNETIFSEIRILWKFSLPAVLSGIMVGPISWMCNVFLVNQPGGYTQMALFDAANQWRVAILFIPGALSQIILPMLSSSVADSKKYNIIFFKNLKLNIIISIIMFLIIALVNPIILKAYGNEFSGLWLPLIILASSTILVSVNNVFGQAIASQGKMWIGFIVNSIWAISLLILSFWLIKILDLGAIGLSIAYLISYIVHSAVQYLVFYKMLLYR